MCLYRYGWHDGHHGDLPFGLGGKQRRRNGLKAVSESVTIIVGLIEYWVDDSILLHSVGVSPENWHPYPAKRCTAESLKLSP